MVLVLSYESLVPMKQTQIKETKQKRKKSKQILLEINFSTMFIRNQSSLTFSFDLMQC